MKKGFTLIELIVALAIFAFMTAFILAKYGTFNQGTILTNTAYDVALVIRDAQSYGLNVQSAPTGTTNFSNTFNATYGIHIDTSQNNPGGNTKIILFSNTTSPLSVYSTNNSVLVSTYILGKNSKITDMCVGGGECNSGITPDPNILDITFTRPNPDAVITVAGNSANVYNFAQITLQATDGSIKKILVTEDGQITVTN